MAIPPQYLDVLKDRIPGLDLSTLRIVRSGLANDVVVVDERLAVRFAKHDWSVEALASERKVLELAGPRLTVAVPRWETWGAGIVAYPFLTGEALGAGDFLRLTPGDRRRIVAEVARFLGELHAISAAEVASAGVGASEARASSDAWATLMEEGRRVLFPIRDAAYRDGMERLFASVRGGLLDPSGDEALIHADLAACHLLWDGREPVLAGVIDFGCAGQDDPVYDLAALLYEYGEEFHGMLRAELADSRMSIDRIRALAGLYLLQEELDIENGIG